jgi:hypothetical protein
MASITRKIDRSPKTIKEWHRIFLTKGLASVALISKKSPNHKRLAIIAKKKARLVKIIHESPSLHGINRTTWTLETLSAAYRSGHGETVSKTSIIALPLYFNFREYVDAGGPLSFGPNLRDMYRQSARHIDKILKGESPGDIPMEQPTRFEPVINLKTAKALGLTVPPLLLARADEVIE